jgi:hypothetical protein
LSGSILADAELLKASARAACKPLSSEAADGFPFSADSKISFDISELLFF